MARESLYGQSHEYEDAHATIKGALALNCILSMEAAGDGAGWSAEIVDDLQGAQRRLMLDALEHVGAMREESWHAHAQLGIYGDKAKAKSLAAGKLERYDFTTD